MISACVLPPKPHLVFGSEPGSDLGILNLESGAEDVLRRPATGEALTLAFSPDEALLACGDRSSLAVWYWPERRLERPLEASHPQVVCATFSPDGLILASAGADHLIRLWSVGTWEPLGVLRGHEYEIHSLAFSPDGRRLASAAADGTIRIWYTTTAARPVPTAAEGRLRSVASIYDAGLPARVWLPGESDYRLFDLFPGADERRISKALFPADASAFQLLAEDHGLFGFPDGHWERWDLKQPVRLEAGTNHGRAVAVISPPAQTGRVAVGHEDGLIEILDGSGVLQFRLSCPFPLAFNGMDFRRDQLLMSLDGSKLMAATGSRPEMGLWDIGTEAQLVSHRHCEPVLTAAFSGDSRRLVTTSFSPFASLWEVATGRELGRFSGELGGFRMAAFSPDNTRVALSANGGGLSVWDPEPIQRLAHLRGPHCQWMAWHSDGNTLALLDELGRIHYWRAPSWAEIAATGRAAGPADPAPTKH